MAKVAQAVDEKGGGRSLELIANLARLFWEDVADRISLLVKSLIEEFLEARRTEVLGAGAYQRGPSRNGHRGGSYARRLKTKWGEVLIRVPRVAGRSYELEIIDRWGRRQVELDEAIGRLPLAGVSTRRLEKVAEELWGIGLSRSQVSEITKRLDAEVASFRGRRIPDTVRYLLADGISAKVMEVGVKGKVFLVAYGIHTGGRREILGFVLADSGSAAAWAAFLGDLKARGLKGRALGLITTCGSKGLRKAVAEVYPLVRVQRCLVHRIRINRPSGLGQTTAAGSPPFFSRPRWPSRLSMTRPWRTTSASHPRSAASSRRARTSVSWLSMIGTNSGAGTKLSQVSQMLA